MMLVDQPQPAPMRPPRSRAFRLAPAPTPAAASAPSPCPPQPSSATRKRKIIVDDPREKRARTFTELEYEETLAEAAALREELELLVAVADDLSADLALDAAPERRFAAALLAIEELFASHEDVTLRQVRAACARMLAMMQHLCRCHYEHFALIDMQDQLRACRDRFMRFVCQHAAMLGL